MTGIAIFSFFEINFITIAALIIGSALSTVFKKLLRKYVPPFTAPFVIVTWLAIYSLLLVFKLPLLSPVGILESTIDIFSASGNSFGQVMFQNNLITGFIFLLGILINNRLMTLYALYAAVLGSVIGSFFIDQISITNSGLMGYNAILCALALTGKTFTDFLWITLAIILSTLFNKILGMTGIITLTAPFFLVTWFILMLKHQKVRRREILV